MAEKLALIDELTKALLDAEYAQSKPGQASGYAVLRWNVQRTLDRLRAEVLLEDRTTSQAEMDYIARAEDAALERAL
jgi:hypothetical protein